MPENQDDDLREIIEAGSDVAGNAVGAAMGFIAGGPPGTVIGGAAAGPVVTRGMRWVATELRSRLTGQREVERVGATLAYSIEAIQELLEAGVSVRNDGFFEDEGERSAANEIAEGVVLAAQRSYEEKKLKYLGRLHAAIAFDSRTSRYQANHLLKLFDSLSYQQLAILQTVNSNRLTRESSWRGSNENVPYETITILSETYDLYRKELINNGGSAMLGMTDLEPSNVEVHGMGKKLVIFCRLAEFDDTVYLDEIAHHLNQEPRPNSPSS
jgi:hypothetical protein